MNILAHTGLHFPPNFTHSLLAHHGSYHDQSHCSMPEVELSWSLSSKAPFSTSVLYTHTSTNPHLLWLSRQSTTINDLLLAVVNGMVFKGTQLCNAPFFSNLIQMSNNHQLLGLLHISNHAPLSNPKLMRQLIP